MSYMNKKGQALIEFILILPVFLMILFTIVDFGMITYTKNKLENNSTDIIRLIRAGESVKDIEQTYSKLKIETSPYQEQYLQVKISNEINIITPFLDRILGNPYSITVERIVPNAQS